MARVNRTKKIEKAAAERQPPVFYRINSLLRVMRVIEQHEEQLCTLMHDIKSSGAVSVGVAAELRTILEEMPSSEYREDLQAVKEALDAVSPTIRKRDPLKAKKSAAKTP